MRLVRTAVFPEPIEELKVDFDRLTRRVPKLRVTVVDAASGLRYRMQHRALEQDIALPASAATL